MVDTKEPEAAGATDATEVVGTKEAAKAENEDSSATQSSGAPASVPEKTNVDEAEKKTDEISKEEKLLRAVGGGDFKGTQAAARGLKKLEDVRTGNGATALHLACFGASRRFRYYDLSDAACR